MLKEFENIYDIHGWLRFLTWLGLLCIGLFLFWAFRLVMRTPVLLHSFPVAAAALSASWFILCGLVLWFSLVLIRHHLKQWKILDRRLFKQHVNEEWLAARETFLQQSDNQYGRGRSASLLFDYAGNGYNHASTDPLMGLQLPQKPRQGEEVTELAPVQLYATGREADIPTRPVSTSHRPSSRSAPPTAKAAGAKSNSTSSARVGVGWNRGIQRKNKPNEDGVAAIQGTCTYRNHIVPFDLFLVADGMGGHADGQEASRTAIKLITQMVLQNIMLSDDLTDSSFTDVLVDGVQQANQAIWKRNREQGSDMGTTITAALVVGTKAYVVNVGDSRTYLYRPLCGLSAITRDHSLVARLVANGVLSPEEAYTYPGRNVIERSLGNNQGVKVDSFLVDLRKGDWLLLCSDGLWEMVRDHQIERIMKSGDNPERISDMLIQAALKGGGADNVSVIVARIV